MMGPIKFIFVHSDIEFHLKQTLPGMGAGWVGFQITLLPYEESQ